MNKEEILAKYRNENVDEGWERTCREGHACGFIAYVVVAFLMFFINVHHGYGNSGLFFETFFLATCAIDNYSKYRFSQEKKYMKWMIFFIAWAVLCLMKYFGDVMGG